MNGTHLPFTQTANGSQRNEAQCGRKGSSKTENEPKGL